MPAKQYQHTFIDLNLQDESYDEFFELLQKKNTCILDLDCGPIDVTKYDINPNYAIGITSTLKP